MATYQVESYNGSTHKYTLVLSVNEDSYSIANNTSSVSWSLTLYSYNSYSFSDWSFPITASVDGEVYNVSTYRTIGKNSFLSIASGSKTISHNSDGSKTISVGATIRANSYSYLPGNMDISGTLTLTQIPRKAEIKTAPNFNDTESPTITYSNPAGTAVTTLQACISLTGATDDVPYRDISKTGSTYTFTLTSSELATLESNTTGNSSRTIYFFIRTIISGTTYYSSIAKTFTVTGATPTLTLTATPTDYSSLTGSADTLIKDVSTIAISGSATAYKEGLISMVKTGNKSLVVGSTSANPRTFSGTLQTSNLSISGTTATLNSYAVDTRGVYSTTDTKTYTIVNYVPLTITAKAERLSATSSTVKATINGAFFNGSFGSQTNTLTLQWYYKLKTDNSYTSGGTLTATLSGNTYSYSGNLTGTFTYNSDYDFKFVAKDLINTSGTESVSTVLKGIPIHDEGVDRNGDNYFNVNGEIYKNNVSISPCMILGYLARNNSFETETAWANKIAGSLTAKVTIGDRLSVSNGVIKIGANVNHIEVSWTNQGLASDDSVGNAGMRSMLTHNGTTSNIGIAPYLGVIDNYVPSAMSPYIVSVSENDTIALYVWSGTPGTIKMLESAILVKVID